MLLLDRFFSAGQGGYYLLVLVFLALLVALYLFSTRHSRTKTKADSLQETYHELDEALLAAVPDEELVNAIVANLMGKLDRRRPDAYRTIPTLAHGRCVVYSVWLLCHELDEAGFEELFASPSGAFTELAADGFEEIGAARCAAALRGALAAAQEGSPGEDGLAELHADFLEGAAAEDPLGRCVAYIRDNAADFLDVEPVAPAPTADADEGSTEDPPQA